MGGRSGAAEQAGLRGSRPTGPAPKSSQARVRLRDGYRRPPSRPRVGAQSGQMDRADRLAWHLFIDQPKRFKVAMTDGRNPEGSHSRCTKQKNTDPFMWWNMIILGL